MEKKFWLKIVVPVALLLALSTGAFTYLTGVGWEAYKGPLPSLTDEEGKSAGRLEDYARTLTMEIGRRNFSTAGSLDKSADYIEGVLTNIGVEARTQTYTLHGKTMRNLIVDFPGRSLQGDVVLIGAHYDTYRRSPGANTNGSGVIALFELARILKHAPAAHTVRLAFFVNGERPWRGTADMGSTHYAERLKESGESVLLALCLDSIGYYSEDPGSQDSPFPMNLVRPDVGDFLSVFGSPSSRPLVERFVKLWNEQIALPIYGAALPGWVPGVLRSDHESFQAQGFPALLLTDTGQQRFEDSGAAHDNFDRLDYERLARLVHGLARLIGAVSRLEA